jgi:hypothetical protein
MRLPWVIPVAASLCLGALTTTAIANAQPAGASVPGKEHAKRLFDEGAELEKKGDFAGALAKYKDAEQITVTPGLRFHTGYCLEMTGKLVAALDAYEAADKLARDQNKAEVRAAVTTRLEPLRARVPQLAIRLTTPPAGAEVQLDGVTVASPLLDGKSFRIEQGEHHVTARAAGFKAFAHTVQIPESTTATVDVVLERTTSSGGAAVVPSSSAQPSQASSSTNELTQPPAEAAARRSLVLPIATTAGAVVLAGTGIALFVAAGGAQSTAQTDCLAKTECESRRSKIRTLDALALGSFVGAAGLGVLSVILWTSKPAERSASARAWVEATPSSLGVAGAF